MNIESIYQLFSENHNITTDSRNIQRGSIYVALCGERFDGNAFAAQAFEKGALYAIIDKKEYYIDHRTILVENTLEILQKLANFHRRKLGIPIIAITGTNGKTTTKELIRSVLLQQYSVCATQGNLNNHIGVPLTLLSMNSDTKIGVVEMGANHPKEIEQLCQIAEPNYGLITNIGKAHLEGFGGFQGVIKAKKELYDFLIDKGGTIFYNSDNGILSNLLHNTNVNSVSYGLNSGNYCRGRIMAVDPYLGINIKTVSGENEIENIQVKTQMVGEYNVENILAAFSVGLYFNIPLQKIQKAIEQYIPINHRSQLTNTEKNRLLLDYYNANPSSTEAAIINFLKLKGQHKVIVLGDMLELGEESEAEHTRILKILKDLKGIEVLLVGIYYKALATFYGFKAFLSFEELNAWLSDNPIDQSFILIKGSRGIQLEKIIEKL